MHYLLMLSGYDANKDTNTFSRKAGAGPIRTRHAVIRRLSRTIVNAAAATVTGKSFALPRPVFVMGLHPRAQDQ
jgi:hypothetical protein